jgi:hypothetical protein
MRFDRVFDTGRIGTAPEGVWTGLRHAAQYRCAPVNADVEPHP